MQIILHMLKSFKKTLIIRLRLHFFSLPAGPENKWPIIQVLRKHRSDTAPVWTGVCIGVGVCVCVSFFGLQNKEAFNALAKGVALQFVQFMNKSLIGIIRGSTVCLAFTAN